MTDDFRAATTKALEPFKFETIQFKDGAPWEKLRYGVGLEFPGGLHHAVAFPEADHAIIPEVVAMFRDWLENLA